MGNKSTKFHTNNGTGSPYMRNSTSFPVVVDHQDEAHLNFNTNGSNYNTTEFTKSLNRNVAKHANANDSPSDNLQKQQYSATSAKTSLTQTHIIPNLVASPLTFRQKNQQLYGQKQRTGDVVNYKQAVRATQNDLTNMINSIDSNSNQPSYHSNSKLYKPNSFLIAKNSANGATTNSAAKINSINEHSNASATTVVNNHLLTPKKNVAAHQQKHASLTSSSSSKSSSTDSASPPQNPRQIMANPALSDANLIVERRAEEAAHLKVSAREMRNSGSSFNKKSQERIPSVSNVSKSSFKTSNTKLNKRFGLSPRFKQKIVETIKNGVQSSLNHHQHDRDPNQKFNQVKLSEFLKFYTALK